MCCVWRVRVYVYGSVLVDWFTSGFGLVVIWWYLVFGCCLIRFCLARFDWLIVMLVCLA